MSFVKTNICLPVFLVSMLDIYGLSPFPFTESPKNDDNDNCCNPSSNSEHLSNSNSTEASDETPPDNSTTLSSKEDIASDVAKEDLREKIDFKIIYNKKKIDITFALDGTVAELKAHLQNIISVPQPMQKIMIKGLAKDDQTLRVLGVTKGYYIYIYIYVYKLLVYNSLVFLILTVYILHKLIIICLRCQSYDCWIKTR
jgi:hypothetical protein